MCALVRSLPGCWRATRGPGDAGPRGSKWPGTVEGGASPGPPAPALSKRPGHLKDGHGCRHRRSLLPRNERRTWLGQARTDRPELGERPGPVSFGSSFRAFIPTIGGRAFHTCVVHAMELGGGVAPFVCNTDFLRRSVEFPMGRGC